MSDIVRCLYTVGAAAVSMSIVSKLLCQNVQIKDSLCLDAIHALFDQAMYAIDVELAWKHNDRFKAIMLKL